jgi:histidinol phosphatase-like enzyme
MEIIVPAAGLSSRFHGMKPKYLLYDYKHEMMLKNAIGSLLKHNVTIGILKEHDDMFEAKKAIEYEFKGAVNVVIIDEKTRGPADTVAKILRKSSININNDIFIKDCDSFFDHTLMSGNYVCVSAIQQHDVLKKLSSKSFVVTNDQGIITSIIEKDVVSNTFCVGGYKFKSAKLYLSAFDEIQTENEIFVSDVIQQCLHYGQIFQTNTVFNYTDVGTSSDWFDYNDKAVIFCDIDGTIVKARPRHNFAGFEPIQENVDILLRKQQEGCQFIFTTARQKEAELETRKALDSMGFKNYTLLMNLLNTKRILINDYNSSNPFPRAEAINIRRDNSNLQDFLR